MLAHCSFWASGAVAQDFRTAAAGTAAGKLFQAITPYADLRVEIAAEDEEGIRQEVLEHCKQFDKIYTAVSAFHTKFGA